MIHGLVPDFWLVASVRINRIFFLVARAGRHGRSLLQQTLIDQKLNFHTTVLRTAVACVVLGYWICFTETVRRDNASQRNAMVFHQITNHCVSSSLAEHSV